MKDQVSRLNSLGISAISLSDVGSELETRAAEKISAGVRECHTPLVNFIGQQQNKSFEVTEINLWLKFSAEPVTAGNTSRVL